MRLNRISIANFRSIKKLERLPHRVEDVLNVGGHFSDQSHAKRFFADPENINAAFEQVTAELLTRP